MADDFLEQLADWKVEEPPARFDQELHQRVNRSLLAQQVIELVSGALPWAAMKFAEAVVGWMRFTLTGRFTAKVSPTTTDREP